MLWLMNLGFAASSSVAVVWTIQTDADTTWSNQANVSTTWAAQSDADTTWTEQ